MPDNTPQITPALTAAMLIDKGDPSYVPECPWRYRHYFTMQVPATHAESLAICGNPVNLTIQGQTRDAYLTEYHYNPDDETARVQGYYDSPTMEQ